MILDYDFIMLLIGFGTVLYVISRLLLMAAVALQERNKPPIVCYPFFLLAILLALCGLPVTLPLYLLLYFTLHRISKKHDADLRKLQALHRMESETYEQQIRDAEIYFKYDLKNGSFSKLKHQFAEEVGLEQF